METYLRSQNIFMEVKEKVRVKCPDCKSTEGLIKNINGFWCSFCGKRFYATEGQQTLF